MTAVQRLKDLMENTIEKLDRLEQQKNREGFIEAFEHFLDEREKLLQEIHPPYTDEEKQMGEQLVALDQTIQEQIGRFFQTLKTSMRNLKKQKHSNKKYNHPYQDVSTMDGMFFDKRN